MVLALTSLNGHLPASMLAVAEEAGPRGAQWLRLDAAGSWIRMLTAGMPAGCLRSGYRSWSEQQAEVERARRGLTPSAARPGRSFHGEGTAVDVDEPARAWVRAWGGSYGWVIDTVPGEPWHMVYDPDLDTSTTLAPLPAPILAVVLDDEEEEGMRDRLRALYMRYLGREPDPAGYAGYGTELATGRMNWTQVEASIKNSAEAKALSEATRKARLAKIKV